MSHCNSVAERCVLCLDRKQSPVQTQCGHSFCRGCLNIYKTYKKYPWANKCPICRDVFKEKRKATKRKYSDQNSSSFTSTSETHDNSNSNANLSGSDEPQPNIFETFMTLAANYDDTGTNQDTSLLSVYENVDDVSYDERDYETDAFLDDSLHDEVIFDTDSDTYSDSHDSNDYNHNYVFSEEDEAASSSFDQHYDYFSPGGVGPESIDEESFINVVDIENVMPRNCTNNFNAMNSSSETFDWESVIPSDVIIID